jgi:pro-kumamolisin-like protein
MRAIWSGRRIRAAGIRWAVHRVRLAFGLVVVASAVGFGVYASGAGAAQKGAAHAKIARAAQAGQTAYAETPLPVRNGTAQNLGAESTSQTIRLAIGLRPPHMAAEQKFLKAIQSKHSPLFHQFLTTSQWTARFGPTPAAQQAVVAWAQQAGLTVTHTYPNRLIVDLSGSVGDIESALNVQINNYRMGSSTFFANAGAPTLPSSLSKIVRSVDGLSSLQTMYPASGGLQEPASAPYSAGPVVSNGASAEGNGSRAKLLTAEANQPSSNITGGAYDPTDIYSSEAYDYNALYDQGHCCNPLNNSGGSPPQTTIAIATFGSQAVSDIQGFHNQYPYLAYSVQEVNIDGTPSCCDAEGTMDAEWSTAMSNSFGSFQDTSKVYLYDGANFNDSTFTDMYNQMVSDNLARVFSTSWSCTEFYGCSAATMSTRDSIFDEMTGQGWTLTAASGDRGAYDDCSHLAVSYPASDPNVVGAGGTELSLSSGPEYNFEDAWSGGPDGCGSNDGGSGGGCSSEFSAPSYQSNQPCGSGSRGVPDISLNADWYHTPQNLYYDGSLSGNGGTSIVAPELAGFFAQENAYLLSEGNICGSGSSACAPMGNANFPIYEAAIDGAPHNPFYDITSGCNTNDIGPGYCAGTGYDLVTGWGSANMLQLAWAFNWHLLADDGRPTVSFSGPTPGTWYNTDQTIGVSVADTGGGFPASGVAGFSDAWNTSPGDPTSEATPGTGNPFYDGPEFINQSSGSLDLSAEGQGCNTVHVEAWDNMGLQSGDVTDGPLCYDTVAPKISTAPTVALKNKVGPVGSTVPVTVTWAGKDTTSGVNHYTLYESKNGGSFSSLGNVSGKSETVNLAPGSTYKFEVTATDNAGNTSAAKAGTAYTLTLLQENASAITYSSGWTRQAVSGANGGDVDFATVAGKTATLSFTGKSVAWMTTEGSNRGSASVSINGGTAKTVSTNASSTKPAEIVDVIKGKSGTNKLVIKVLGTSGKPRVDVDAFVVLS